MKVEVKLKYEEEEKEAINKAKKIADSASVTLKKAGLMEEEKVLRTLSMELFYLEHGDIAGLVSYRKENMS